MKKAIPLLALLSLLTVATAPAAVIEFNPANPLNVVNQGGFTGTASAADEPYTQVRLIFAFSGLNPSPLLSSFDLTNISVVGPGISSSLSFSPLTITQNGTFFTSYSVLNASVQSVNFATEGVAVSFDTPGEVMNVGARFTVRVSYANTDGLQVGTSSTTGTPTFEAVPEPSTYALLALAAVGLAAYRWRQRVKSVA